MLIIRPDQQEVFELAADALFEQRVMTFLRENHGDTMVEVLTEELSVDRIPDDLLRRMVQNGIERARKYGLTWESSLMSFVAIMLEVAPNFDKHPVIESILTNESIPPESRIDEFWDESSEEDWEEIEENYDADAWLLTSDKGDE